MLVSHYQKFPCAICRAAYEEDLLTEQYTISQRGIGGIYGDAASAKEAAKVISKLTGLHMAYADFIHRDTNDTGDPLLVQPTFSDLAHALDCNRLAIAMRANHACLVGGTRVIQTGNQVYMYDPATPSEGWMSWTVFKAELAGLAVLSRHSVTALD